MNWLTRLLWSDEKKPPASWDEWIIAASDRSGFVREAAVNALAQSDYGPALPTLLARLNDWVPEVRRAALAAVRAFLVEEHAASWSSSLGQVAALMRGGRADHSQILGLIARFLVEPRVLAAVKLKASEISQDGRRYLLRLEIEATDAHGRIEVLRLALQSPDVVIALIAAAEIPEVVESQRRLELAGLACVSRFAPIRAAGLREVISIGEQMAAPLVESLCLDSNAFVRSLALTSISSGREGLLERARQRFVSDLSGKHRAVAFEVMCALDPDHAESVIAVACSDAAAVVRRAAFSRLLSTTTGLSRDRLIQRILEDESAVVREIAVRQIKRGDAPPQLEWLRGLLARRPASLNSLVRVSVHLPPWTRLEFLLGTLVGVQSDDQPVSRLQVELEAWDHDIRRCFVTPSQLEAASLRHSWKAARDLVETRLQRSISYHLSSVGVLATLD